jgi:hypothetical protein
VEQWLRALSEAAYALLLGWGAVGLGLAVLALIGLTWLIRRATRG